MITRAIDSEHDWTFGNGKQNYYSQKDALAQNLNTRLMCFIKDCFFDLGAGIDWFTFLGSKNIAGLKLAVSALILSTTGVNSMTELNFNADNNRKLTITYGVISSWSEAVMGTVAL